MVFLLLLCGLTQGCGKDRPAPADAPKPAEVKGDEGKTALHRAAEDGNLDEVKSLIEKGADVHVKDNDDKTALHYAVEYENMDVIKYFVEEKELDVHVKDNDGTTVLHYAAAVCENIDVIGYLVEKGAEKSLAGKLRDVAAERIESENRWDDARREWERFNKAEEEKARARIKPWTPW
jgi:ankyrin repeat protein